MFWLAIQALNSKQSAKGYVRIIRDILRRSGYFNKQPMRLGHFAKTGYIFFGTDYCGSV